MSNYRDEHFEIKVETPHRAMQEKGNEIYITYTTNGYQWNSFVFREKEAMKMVKLIKEFYSTEKEKK